MTRGPDFDGDTYDAARDKDRLVRQLGRVRDVMLDGKWRTLLRIANEVGAPEASVSARLRDLRKVKFGGYIVDRRYLADGLWEYHVSARPKDWWRCVNCGTATNGGVEPRLGGFGWAECATCGRGTPHRPVVS